MGDDQGKRPDVDVPFEAEVPIGRGRFVLVRAPDAAGLAEAVARIAELAPGRSKPVGTAGPPPNRPGVAINPDLDEVAAVYKAALGRGSPPRTAVSEHFGVALKTATNFVNRARQAGHDLPVRMGRGTQRPPTKATP